MTHQTEALAERLDEFLSRFDEDEQERILRHAINHIVPKLKARTALSSQPPAPREGDFVLVPRDLIGAACAAITKKHDAPKTLEQLRRYTIGDLSQPS